VAFRLAFIGSDFQVDRREAFDTPFMRALFDYGYAQARQPWHTVPPGGQHDGCADAAVMPVRR
jgi:hypothetical protein